ncbi:hypothetical protein DPMN_184594 [Dreissena polymorpha]|uniref:Uncharacterized protein n=1 Tax=Dreissena polymorpha TaxID=45954 RepID=A0A9D4DJJ7_DREPO|nr:hypothetical protein DPMN_184594 [Dreissena polymorpha]
MRERERERREMRERERERERRERERERIGEICCSNSANYIFYTYALALSTFRLHQGLVNTDMVVHAILDMTVESS